MQLGIRYDVRLNYNCLDFFEGISSGKRPVVYGWWCCHLPGFSSVKNGVQNVAVEQSTVFVLKCPGLVFTCTANAWLPSKSLVLSLFLCPTGGHLRVCK